MPKPLKLRRVNEIVGLFIIVSIGLAIGAVVLGPRTRRWLTPTRRLAIHLPPEGALGLRKGADVLILGSVVGSVDDISVSDSGEMMAEVGIRGNFIRFVREDSVGIIRKPLGIGDAYVEITRGKGAPLADSGAMLASVADKEPTELIQETLAAFRTEALPAVKEMRTAVARYAQLAEEMRSQQNAIRAALVHFNDVGDLLEHGNGIAAMLLSDPTPATALREALPKLNQSLSDLGSVLADARKISGRLSETADIVAPQARRVPAIAGNLEAITASLKGTTSDIERTSRALPQLLKSTQSAADAVPGLLLQVEETSRQLQRLAEALQRNWLVRGYVDQQPPARGRIAPDRVGAD